MGIEYLDNYNWIDITREERLFCAELYFEIRGKEKEFVKCLNAKTYLDLDEGAEWEIGYEVCFYRDYYKRFFPLKSIKETNYPQKRTFDLCLFSNKEIVIIEAKAQTGFSSKQNKEFKADKHLINQLLTEDDKEKIMIKLLGVCSSKYIENDDIYGKAGNLEFFERNVITWKELYKKYNNPIFRNTDKVYKK